VERGLPEKSGREMTMGASFIKLTHVFDKKQTPV
jgi:hypothetical protein